MLCLSLCLLVAFVAWTLLVRFVDVEAIGPQGSSVGFAALNQFVHGATGVVGIVHRHRLTVIAVIGDPAHQCCTPILFAILLLIW